MVRVWVWTREADGWSDLLLTRLEDVIELPAIGVTLPLAEVNEGVPLAPPLAHG